MPKADPTLVKASFLEAQSRAGSMVPDLKPLYDSAKKISGGYLTLITDIMDDYKLKKKNERIAKEKQLEKFTKIADDNLVKLYSQKQPISQKVITAAEEAIEELQNKFELVNTLGDGDTKENKRARLQILGELAILVDNAVNNRAHFMQLKTHVDGLNMDEVNADVIDPIASIVDLKNIDENDNVTVSYGKDGFVYTTKNYWSSGEPGTENYSTWGDAITFTSQEILDHLPLADITADTDYIEMLNNSASAGATHGLDNDPIRKYNANDQRALFINTIKDKKDFRNFATRRIENLNELSFKEALLDDINIPINILDNMFYDDNGQRVNIGSVFLELDKNNDNVINAEDLTLAKGMGEVAYTNFEANIDYMIDVLTNIDNPAFSLETSRELLADYYMSFDEQKYNNGFDLSVKSKQKNISSGDYNPNINILGGVWVAKTDADRKIRNVIQGDVDIYDWKGFRWVPNGDGTYTETTSGKTLPAVEMLSGTNFGLSDRMRSHFSDDFPNVPSTYYDDNPLEKQRVGTTNLDMNSIFTERRNNNQQHTAESFLGYDEMKIANILRQHWEVGSKIIWAGQGKYEKHGDKYKGKVIVIKTNEYSNNVDIWPVNTKQQIQDLLNYFNSGEWKNKIDVFDQ